MSLEGCLLPEEGCGARNAFLERGNLEDYVLGGRGEKGGKVQIENTPPQLHTSRPVCWLCYISPLF